MSMLLLAGCAGSVVVEGAEPFGLVLSATWRSYDQYEEEGSASTWTRTTYPAIRITTVADDCARQQAYYEAVQEALEEAADNGDECDAWEDFLRAEAEAQADSWVEGSRLLTLLPAGCNGSDESACESPYDDESQELEPGEADSAWGAYAILPEPPDPDDAADRWDEEACAWDEDADDDENTDAWVLADGGFEVEEQAGDAMSIRLEAKLYDADDYVDEGGIDDLDDDGSIDAQLTAVECEY